MKATQAPKKLKLLIQFVILSALLSLSLIWTYNSFNENLMKSNQDINFPGLQMHGTNSHDGTNNKHGQTTLSKFWDIIPKIPSTVSALLLIFLGRVVYNFADDFTIWLKSKFKLCSRRFRYCFINRKYK